jgi:NitT/TauT family transport system ATP-binding protein
VTWESNDEQSSPGSVQVPLLSRTRSRADQLTNPSRSDAAVSLVDLSVEFTSRRGRRIEALGPIDLTVPRGQFLSIVGPSGCGKSTLLRVIAGLQAPTRGSAEILLKSTSKTPIATVFQDFGIFPWKTVLANVEFGLRMVRVSRREARERSLHWLERVGLRDFADAYPAELSGGMKQRVAIARSLVVEPEILLMDEPFAALDAQRREILQDELRTLCSNGQYTVIFITHSLEEAIVLGDRIIVMTRRPGRILDDTEVPFARASNKPLRETPQFAALRGRLWEHLRAEVE